MMGQVSLKNRISGVENARYSVFLWKSDTVFWYATYLLQAVGKIRDRRPI